LHNAQNASRGLSAIAELLVIIRFKYEYLAFFNDRIQLLFLLLLVLLLVE